MKPAFDVTEYIGKNAAIHCRTDKEYAIVADYLDSIGKHWRTGGKFSDKIPSGVKRGDFCISFNSGTWDHFEYFERNDYMILECCDFSWPEENGFEETDEMRYFLSKI